MQIFSKSKVKLNRLEVKGNINNTTLIMYYCNIQQLFSEEENVLTKKPKFLQLPVFEGWDMFLILGGKVVYSNILIFLHDVAGREKEVAASKKDSSVRKCFHSWVHK